jgi:hypothetical protein
MLGSRARVFSLVVIFSSVDLPNATNSRNCSLGLKIMSGSGLKYKAASFVCNAVIAGKQSTRTHTYCQYPIKKAGLATGF